MYESGLIVKNATLDVYKNGTKVGTASTGDSGVASYTYTGVADGEVEFQFKYGSVVSQLYNIIDATVCDINNSRGTSLYYVSRGGLAEVGDGKTFTRSTTGASYFILATDNTYANRLTFPTNVAMEFEITSSTNARVNIENRDASTTGSTHYFTTNGKYKLEVYATGFKLTKDETTVITNNTTTSNGSSVSLIFYLRDSADTLSFKNIAVYPI